MSPDGRRILTLESTHRLTPSISLHRFSGPAALREAIQPSQFITLQFPETLDPIGGGRNLSNEDRKLSFTPCRLSWSDQLSEIWLLARNGRTTGLIGLPRPNGPLQAELIDIGGGFSQDQLQREGSLICIGGGTGLSCFTAMGSQPTNTLVLSIRAEDFDLVIGLLKLSILDPKSWRRIKLFVTAGNEKGTLAGRALRRWEERLTSLGLPSNVDCHLRRLEARDVEGIRTSEGTVLFCGGKALEWQVRMWALDGADVFTTWRA